MYTSKLKIKKNVFSERLKQSLLMAGFLRLSGTSSADKEAKNNSCKKHSNNGSIVSLFHES